MKVFGIGYEVRDVSPEEAERLVETGRWRTTVPELTVTTQMAEDGKVRRVKSVAEWPD